MFLLIIGSFVPAILLTYIVYQADLHREPLSRVALAFLIGVISPLVTLEIANYTMAVPELIEHHPYIRAFLAAALLKNSDGSPTRLPLSHVESR